MTHARVEFSGQSFEASSTGFVWTKRGGDGVQGSWSRIASVMTFEASVSVYGADVGRWQHLGITLDDGTGFTTSSKDAAMFEVAAMTVRLAGPLILERMRHRLHAGETLSFGPVTLSTETLGFKGKSWPIAQLAGHKTYQGHWLFDTGSTEAPKLSGQVMLNGLTNFFALRVLLNELAPGLEYEDGVDKGSVFRPSASSHDPRYVSGRSRLMVFGTMGAALVLALLVIVVNKVRYAIADSARASADIELAAKSLGAIHDAHVLPGTPWSCDLKLQDRYRILFATRTPKDIKPPYPKDPDAIFELGWSGAQSAYDREQWLLFAEVKSVTPLAEERTIALTLKLLDTKTQTIKCAGEQRLAFAGTATQGTLSPDQQVTRAIEKAMLRAVCDPEASACLGDSIDYETHTKFALRDVSATPAVAAAELTPPKAKAKPKQKTRRR